MTKKPKVAKKRKAVTDPDVEEAIWQQLEKEQRKEQDRFRQMEPHWRAKAARDYGTESAALTERAWAAGFWDGEGHASVSKRGDGGFNCSVDQNERVSLERFQAIVGGIGSIKGPKRRVTEKGKRTLSYRWAISSQPNALQLWNAVGPFLSSPKRIQLSRVLGIPTATKLRAGKPLPEGSIGVEVEPRGSRKRKAPM